MNSAQSSEIIAGLDIGSTHVTLVVAHIPGESELQLAKDLNQAVKHQILGATRVNHAGMRKGAIVHFEAVVSAIQEAVDEVERQTGVQVETVRLSTASPTYVCENATEVITLKHEEIRSQDITKLHQHATEQKPATGWDYIHTLPTQYVVDGKPGIINPVGMYGHELACIYHRVKAPQMDLRNIIKACNMAGVHIESLVFESLAAAEAVLDSDEKELGICSINIGSHLTHVAIYVAGVPLFCKDYAFGSHHITKDLSIGLRTTQSEAERIKREFGQAFYTLDGSVDIISVASLDGQHERRVTKGEVWTMIEPRVREIFESIRQDLMNEKQIENLTKGMVLSGGGSLLNGICMVAEDVFGKPARIGSPQTVAGVVEGLRTPWASSVIGLLSSLFSPPEIEPSLLERAGALSTKEGWTALAKTVWNRVSDPFVH